MRMLILIYILIILLRMGISHLRSEAWGQGLWAPSWFDHTNRLESEIVKADGRFKEL